MEYNTGREQIVISEYGRNIQMMIRHLMDIENLLGLSPIDRALVRSVGRNLAEGALYKEVFITLGGKKSGVFALEVSPEEAMVYESDKVKKRPLFEETERTGSIRKAINNLTKSKV